jgi:lysophospholipase L1-like esterase
MKFRSRIIGLAVGAYCILTLPVMLVFLKSEYLRYAAIQTVTNWKGKLQGLPFAYVGDSITAGGRNWGSFFGAINLAGDGYTVWQIKSQTERAEKYSPKRLFILAGTNDLLERRQCEPKQEFDLTQFESDYGSLLDLAAETKAEVYVTLIPFTSREERNRDIQSANDVILRLAQSKGIITLDLNPILAPRGGYCCHSTLSMEFILQMKPTKYGKD